jgi:hypothetical protein
MISELLSVNMQSKKFAFSGRMGSGKDYVAKIGGMKIFGFADPIYEISQYFLGTQDKSNPEVRKFMQLVGQVGRGEVTRDYPASMERCLFVQMMRDKLSTIFGWTDDYGCADWSKYGNDSTFWITLLLWRTHEYERTHRDALIAVTNVRFENELEALKKHGFQHFHVKCFESERIERLGSGWSEKLNDDLSEKLAQKLDAGFVPTICNGAGKCEPENTITVEQFLKDYVQCPQSIGCDKTDHKFRATENDQNIRDF